MLKGKSTIELFDGITGKKKEEYKDENIVTNAPRNLLDFNNEMLMQGVPLNDMLARLTPLYPQYLRGILLWENIIEENDGHVLPPPGSVCVGHAGGSYSGANALRGSLNTTETAVTENGVRMVWDFATDKANSTIRSISLTSVPGGDRGWMTPWESGTFFRERINNGSRSQGMVEFLTRTPPGFYSGINAADRVYLGELRRGVNTYAINRSGALVICEQTYRDPSALGIRDGAGLQSINSAYCREEEFPVDSNAAFSLLSSNSIVVGENMVHVSFSGTSNRNARIRVVNAVTKTLVSDRTVALSGNLTIRTSSATFFKNKIYAVITGSGTMDGINEFDVNGTHIRRVMAGANGAGRFYCIGGEYLIGPPDSSNNTIISDGVRTVVTRLGQEDGQDSANLMNAFSLKPPLYVFYRDVSATSFHRNIFYITPYMATINNLSSPVVKNEQNTMKVTYELTQD
jgi:hypothetical protein